MKKITLLLLAALAASSASAQKLVIKGSDTLGAKLVPQLAEAYKAKNPGVSFEIAAEGSTTGIAAIIDGTAQIGMSSRRAKATEMSAGTAEGRDLAPHDRGLRRHRHHRERLQPSGEAELAPGGANLRG
jgi:phosphate transport system substrate-binding protein